jgi:membrane-associated protein
MNFLQLFLHLDTTLGSAITAYGAWIYAALFFIVFCETGLVVTPFLPGDSLLFAAGAFAAAGQLDPWIVFGLMFSAAVLGDALNYRIGRKFGASIVAKGSFLGLPIRAAHVAKTQSYYARYGVKTIVLARFIPIVRTIAPFVAGVGEMSAATFTKYNIIGGLLWTALFVLGGYFFGNIPIVKKNFEIVILAIVFISILPIIVEYLRERRKA